MEETIRIKELLCRAQSGESLWLPELRRRFEADGGAYRAIVRLVGENSVRDYPLSFPRAEDAEDMNFLLRYAAANVYNILSAFSGREIKIFCGDELRALLAPLPEMFDAPDGMGKVRNIARRIHGSFRICFAPEEEYASAGVEKTPAAADLGERLLALCKEAEGKNCAGVDIGGSDIKLAVSAKGRLLYTKEYDWNPAASPTAEGILDPILALIREAKERIAEAGGTLDAVGISFPDIVIADRIVGGETPKTKAMRENTALDYEREFAKLRELRSLVLPLCVPGGEVRLTNDGNMAAFTAAVELAAGGETERIRSGVIAHSLGTDLGTGWLRADGTIPAFPLEMYDLLLDLGDLPSAALPPEDLRSSRNENSGMNGVRRYLGQAAAYRLAWKLDEKLLDGFCARKGERLFIPTSPVDQRKPCLEHLMHEASQGNAAAEEIFRTIGENLSFVTREMQWLFGDTPPSRILFGRFVKSRRCFELLCEGFEKGKTGVTLLTADEDLANTALMKQLAAAPGVTVAQFAQAVGSIFYALT